MRRVLAKIDIEQLEREIDAWLERQGNEREPREPLAMDGKCLKGSYDHDRQADGTRAAEGLQQQLTVVGIDTRQMYAQQGFTGAKEDAEGSVAGQVLERLDLDGHCVLVDALHTQRSAAELILQGGGDYVFVVQGHQPGLRAYDWESLPSTTYVDLNRHRIETRTIAVAEDLAGRLDFPGVRVAARSVRSSEYKSGENRRGPETVYLPACGRSNAAADC